MKKFLEIFALARDIDTSFEVLQTKLENAFPTPGKSLERTLGLILQQNLAIRRSTKKEARKLRTETLNVIMLIPRKV